MWSLTLQEKSHTSEYISSDTDVNTFVMQITGPIYQGETSIKFPTNTMPGNLYIVSMNEWSRVDYAQMIFNRGDVKIFLLNVWSECQNLLKNTNPIWIYKQYVERISTKWKYFQEVWYTHPPLRPCSYSKLFLIKRFQKFFFLSLFTT